MDGDIAPSTDASDAIQSDGGDPIAAYRRYLEQNTGDRVTPLDLSLPPRLGPPNQDEPSDPDNPNSTPDQGAGPYIAPTYQIAPPQGVGPETNDGGTEIAPPAQGAGVQAAGAPQGQGAGPDIAPGPPPAVAQAAPGIGIGGGGVAATPTLDGLQSNPVANIADAPQAPQAPQAPLVAQAPMAKNVAQAPQAAQAPTIGPQPKTTAGDDLTSDDSQMTPASGHVIPGAKTADGRPLINIHPPGHSPDDFDTDKLATAHTAADVFDALSVAKQSQYMNWWEQQHGDIDDRYNALQADLGTRPDPNRDPTKTEKFTELMNFGLNLLRNNKRGGDPMQALGTSAQEALGTQQQKQQAQTADFDARSAAITKARQADQKDIGNYGQAVREDAINKDTQTRTAIAQANAAKPPKVPPTRAAERSYDAQGNMTVRDDDPTSPTFGKWMPAQGANGNLGPQNIQGPRGGSTAGGSKQIEALTALESRGYSTADAVNTVFHVKPSGDPFHDYTSILNKNTPQGATADEKADAAQTAEDTVNHMYGPNALANARARRQSTISGPGGAAPPAPPPPGKIGTDAQGNRWKNVNGVAVPAS
jgi:hypothetical protein